MDNEKFDNSSSPNWRIFIETKNKADVLRHLELDGWEVKKQTFYNHCKSGKLTKDRNGFYTRRLVKKYAETWLVRTVSGKSIGEESENLLAIKTREDIKRIKVIREREEFRLGVDQSKYILRSEIEFALASRAVVLGKGFEHLFQSCSPDMIAIVGGDQQRNPELLEFLLRKTDELFNEYANMDRFRVIFAPDQLDEGDNHG